MEVYRVVSEKYADDLSGYGAYLYGGRWNYEGVYALYTSSSRALAMLEFMVHLPTELLSKNEFVLLSIQIPDEPIDITLNAVDIGLTSKTAQLGTSILEAKKILSFKVPSIIVPEESNIIINPKHVDATQVKTVHTRPLVLDYRFLGR